MDENKKHWFSVHTVMRRWEKYNCNPVFIIIFLRLFSLEYESVLMDSMEVCLCVCVRTDSVVCTLLECIDWAQSGNEFTLHWPFTREKIAHTHRNSIGKDYPKSLTLILNLVGNCVHCIETTDESYKWKWPIQSISNSIHVPMTILVSANITNGIQPITRTHTHTHDSDCRFNATASESAKIPKPYFLIV